MDQEDEIGDNSKSHKWIKEVLRFFETAPLSRVALFSCTLISLAAIYTVN